MAEILRRARGTLLVVGAAIAACEPGCYAAGNGTAPPGQTLYFPVGLAVSRGGNVLYAVNSDFDLQWNGGTIQSYDLNLIRNHALLAIKDPSDPNLPLIRPAPNDMTNACPGNPPVYQTNGSGNRQQLGETCSPPVDSTFYVRDSAIIGAFATDLQISACDPTASSDPASCARNAGTRLFMPVRGDASLTWADVAPDDVAPPPNADATTYPPFALDCGTRVDNRCDAAHHAGINPNEQGNTRGLVMPGEPFGMAQSEDGTVIAVTHQNDTLTSLFSTGLNAPQPNPSLQFILTGVPIGGNGVAAVPHDPAAFPACALGASAIECAPRPSFLQTSRNVAEIDLLRFYADQGGDQQSSLVRPFLVKEAAFTLTANAGGSDSRGILIDKSPRLACKASSDKEREQCARRPARVFFANRAPSSMIVGEIGEPSAAGDGTYDADRLVVFGNVPLTFGPSRLYLAPIVDQDGNYALRVFIVCFDSSTIFVYDPDAGVVENIIRVGQGPFALAFDPFSLADVAAHKHVDPDPRAPGGDLLKYRFAYIASFTKSFVQLVDLDNSRADKSTYERVVFTLGQPTPPKGTQ